MAKFITDKELEEAVYHIIWDAEETLLIVSPFVKLGDYFKKLFEKHVDNHALHLLLVFGKNEGNESKSLGKGDFDFFKQFRNVSIIYEPKLHAKYYGNEKKGVITSINLHDYSFKNNIEYGVYSETGILNSLTNQSDKEAWNKSQEIADSGEAIFIKRPVFKKHFLGSITGGKDFVKAEVLLDVTDSIYSQGNTSRGTKKHLQDFPDSLDSEMIKAGAMPTRAEVEQVLPKKADRASPVIPSTQDYTKGKQSGNNIDTGYCIRTGKQISFNPERPYSIDAYKSWVQYGNVDYKEKYCHKTGQPSNGKTSMRNPVL